MFKKTLSFLLTFIGLIALNACDQTEQKNTSNETGSQIIEESIESNETTKDGITSETVTYYSQHPEAQGYLAMPQTGTDLPTIILIHQWWGVDEDMKHKAQQFAKEGYVALAVDLYDGKSAQTTDEARELAGKVQSNMEEAFNNLNAAVIYLKNLPNVDIKRLASVGWCFGGNWSYLMAKNDLGTKVSIMYYGRFSPKDDLSMMKALILGHFGAEDTSINVDDVKEFQVTLGKLDKRHEIYIYPNAGHGFANETSNAYNKEASDLAWQRTLDFLKKNL